MKLRFGLNQNFFFLKINQRHPFFWTVFVPIFRVHTSIIQSGKRIGVPNISRQLRYILILFRSITCNPYLDSTESIMNISLNFHQINRKMPCYVIFEPKPLFFCSAIKSFVVHMHIFIIKYVYIINRHFLCPFLGRRSSTSCSKHIYIRRLSIRAAKYHKVEYIHSNLNGIEKLCFRL